MTPDFGIGLQTDEDLDRVGVGLDMEIDSWMLEADGDQVKTRQAELSRVWSPIVSRLGKCVIFFVYKLSVLVLQS